MQQNGQKKNLPWWIARAGGRRRYNAERQAEAVWRRDQIPVLFIRYNLTQSQIARRLGVHRSTISRDFKKMRQEIGFWEYAERQVKWLREVRRTFGWLAPG